MIHKILIIFHSKPYIKYQNYSFEKYICIYKINICRFHVLLDIVPADNKRYRYAYHRSQWLVAGKADPAPPHRLYPHPDGPFSLDQLRKQVTSFEKVKITNNESDNSGQVRTFFNRVSMQSVSEKLL